jgi:hypothetical protein
MHDYYVYAHVPREPRILGDVFYIGKGRRNRAWRVDNRNLHWRKIAEKYGYSVMILAANLSDFEALELEKSFILCSGRTSLCNMTDGGEGVSGWHASEETRARASAARKGRKYSEETKRKMSLAKKGRKFTEAHKASMRAAHKGMSGRTLSPEHRAKLSASMKGRKK